MANWWDPLPLGMQLTINGHRAVRTAQGVALVGTDEYEQTRVKSPADQKALETLDTTANQSRYLANGAHQFMSDYDTQKPGALDTGPLLGAPVVGPVLKFGANVLDSMTQGGATPLQDMDSTNAAYWSYLRQPGSGQIRGYEAQGPAGWQRAFPNTANGAVTNQHITDRMDANASDAEREAAFVHEYMRQGGPSVAAGRAAFQRMLTRQRANDALIQRSQQTRAAQQASPSGGMLTLNPDGSVQ